MKKETTSKVVDFNPATPIIILKENSQNKLNKNQILRLKEKKSKM